MPKVALNWTTAIKRHETDTKILYLELRDARKDPSFSAATLNASPDRDPGNHCYPGIPLDTALLKEQEESNRFECSQVVVHFKDMQGTLYFCSSCVFPSHRKSKMLTYDAFFFQGRDEFEKEFKDMRSSWKRLLTATNRGLKS